MICDISDVLQSDRVSIKVRSFDKKAVLRPFAVY